MQISHSVVTFEDKLSSTAVDFIRSEGIAERQHLIRGKASSLSELAFPHIRCCLSAIPSDLMKSTAVDESLSSMNQQFCSRENQLLQMLQQNEKSAQT